MTRSNEDADMNLRVNIDDLLVSQPDSGEQALEICELLVRSNAVDVIIVDSTDPVGPAEGLFNEAFYRECLRCLRPNGILAQQSESPLFHLSLIESMRQTMQVAGFTNTRTLFFPQFIYPSGWWSGTLAGKGDLTRFRKADARSKPFATRYYNADMHRAAFVAPEFFRQALGQM